MDHMTTSWRQIVSAKACRWVLLVLTGMLVLLLGALIFAGRWLAVEAVVPRAADVVVILAGSFDRTLHAADLYNKGMARRVAISRPVAEPVHLRLAERGFPMATEEDIHRRILLHLGIPETAIDFLPGYSQNTRDEGLALARYLSDQQLRAIIVTSPYHVRRASIILRRYLADSQPIQVVPTPYEEFEWRWWRDPASARSVLLELAKVLYFVVQGDTNR